MKALVTGAVHGLGRAIAEQLMEQGYTVTAVDRDQSGLFDMGQSHVGQCETVTLDLADAEAVSAFATGCIYGPFDIIVHNAGISATGKFEQLPPSAYQRLININLKAPILLTTALVGSGKTAKACRIIFVSSLSHFTGYPGAAVYGAAKDGLAVYAKSISKAFKKRGVSTLTVFPGPLRTDHARKHAPPGARENRRMVPEKAATLILKAAKSKKKTLVPGTGPWFASQLGQLFPGLTTRMMRRAIYDKLVEPRF